MHTSLIARPLQSIARPHTSPPSGFIFSQHFSRHPFKRIGLDIQDLTLKICTFKRGSSRAGQQYFYYASRGPWTFKTCSNQVELYETLFARTMELVCHSSSLHRTVRVPANHAQTISQSPPPRSISLSKERLSIKFCEARWLGTISLLKYPRQEISSWCMYMHDVCCTIS
jgi:hypothetical protein